MGRMIGQGQHGSRYGKPGIGAAKPEYPGMNEIIFVYSLEGFRAVFAYKGAMGYRGIESNAMAKGDKGVYDRV